MNDVYRERLTQHGGLIKNKITLTTNLATTISQEPLLQIVGHYSIIYVFCWKNLEKLKHIKICGGKYTINQFKI